MDHRRSDSNADRERATFLYIHNYHPERWPSCDPETNFGNCDDGPTKEVLKLLGGYYFNMSFGFRPAEELYQLSNDPHGVRNLANDPAFTDTLTHLKSQMLEMLKEEGDPRALGFGAIFDTYEYVKKSPKDYNVWLETQNETLSLEADRLSETKKPKSRIMEQVKP